MLLFHEWPLVLFTLLAQMAVGIVFVGECMLRDMTARNAGQSVNTSIRRQSCFSLVLLAAAALLSLSHTGTPLHSFNTILNVGSSWLSREIIMMGLFGLSLLWLCLMRLKSEPQPGERLAAVLSILLGFALIAATAQVYRLSTVPGWNNGAIFFHFFGSAFILGAFWHGLAAGVAHSRLMANICVEGQPAIAFSSLLMYAFAGFALIAASLPLMATAGIMGEAGQIGVGGQNVMTGIGGMLNSKTVLIPLSCLVWSWALHALALALAVLLFMGCVLRTGFLRSWPPALGMLIAFLLLFAGEFFGRTLFYLSYARIGM